MRLHSDRVVLPEGERPATVEIADGSIVAVDRDVDVDVDRDVDLSGWRLTPGLVDLQVNGGAGIDLAREPERMWELAHWLVRHGVTAFLPTIVSGPADVRTRALAAIASRPSDHAVAEPVGVHFEGPMLASDHAGAHRRDQLVPPNPDLVAAWSASAGVRLVTLAPELPGALDVVAELVGRGVTVAAGHTGATAIEFAAARDAGVGFVTHVFNAMRTLHHRDPGLVGAALTDDATVVAVIADGVHVDPLVVDLVWRAKRGAGVVLVSDSVAPAGTLDVDAGRARATDGAVRLADGTLAGSLLTLDRAVVEFVRITRCSWAEAIACATATPAQVVGLTDRGRIAPRTRADLAVIDERGTVQTTICAGHVAYATAASYARFAGG